jgi:hypothetical protein
MDYIENVKSFICEYAESIIETNTLKMSKTWFYDEFVKEILIYVKQEGIQAGWYYKLANEEEYIDNEDSDDEDSDDEDSDDFWNEYIHRLCTEIYKIYNLPKRQILTSDIDEVDNIYELLSIEQIDTILTYLENIPAQSQRSEEWYNVRKTLFSASNIWKLFGTECQYNSIIYEKCIPNKIISTSNSINNKNDGYNDPRSWGIKYEPVTLMIYEYVFKTRVKSDYGCISHINETIQVGASPDAINIDKNNTKKYGTMVEVKNIVNRDITGIPSEEYWIQMQTQMEVCNLDKCDFVETRFKEYTCRSEIENDTNKRHIYKGVILLYLPLEKNKENIIQYSPIQYTNITDIDKWIIGNSTLIEKTHILYNTTYWYLDELSCTLVERNSYWFHNAIPIIRSSWKVVDDERKNGYEHRAPKSRKNTGLIEEVVNKNTYVCVMKLDETGNII